MCKALQPVFRPLLGEQHFLALMRSKPLARSEAYLLHAQIIPKQLNFDLEHSETTISLGMVIPKKAYALAVDRNRIRRVLRAYCALELKKIKHDVHFLFRVKTLPKSKNIKSDKAKFISDITTVINPKGAYLNPHSQAFSQCIKALIAQTAQQLASAESATLSDD